MHRDEAGVEPDYTLRLQMLAEVMRFPWVSAVQLALRLGISPAVALRCCVHLTELGLLRAAEQGLAAYPRVRYAPTEKTIAALSQVFGQVPATVQRQLHLTPGRFWAMRLAMEVCQEVVAVLGATVLYVTATRDVAGMLAQRLGIEVGEFDVFVPRQHKTHEIFLHGKLVLRGTPTRVYYLLLDRGEGSIWQWYAHLKYLNQWASRLQAEHVFPTLLILTTRPYRADAMLELARMAGGKLTVAASADREIALTRGVLGVAEAAAQQEANANTGWHTLMPGGQIMRVNPFDGPAMTDEAYLRSVHVIPPTHIAKGQDSTSAAKRTRSVKSQVDTESTDVMPANAVTQPNDLWSCPVDGAALRTFEALSDLPYRVLTFLSRNPGVPAATLAVLLDLTSEQSDRLLAELEHLKLARTLKSRTPVPLWAATDIAIQLRLLREMQPDNLGRRYRFFRADHERRGMHTLATYRFFENLKTACAGRSRAMRKLDTKPNTLNEGHIPYYALASHESEYVASDWFVVDGQTRYWRPDGYGVVRAGEAVTRFWIEMDGTEAAPSRHDPAIWSGKFTQLYDYLASNRWRLRYEGQPVYAIVTTEIKNARHAYDALWSLARGRDLTPPRVYMATREAISQRGALGKVWLDITQGGPEFGYAFANVAPICVISARTQRKDLIADLQQAEALGLMG